MLETKQESWMRLVGFVAGLPDVENKNWGSFLLLLCCPSCGLVWIQVSISIFGLVNP